MIHRGETRCGLLSEILFLGSGVVIFVPLLLLLVAALTELTAFR
jgi:hypothetical protein